MKTLIKIWIYITRYIFNYLDNLNFIKEIEKKSKELYNISREIKKDGSTPENMKLLHDLKWNSEYYFDIDKYKNLNIDIDFYEKRIYPNILLLIYDFYIYAQYNIFHLCTEYDASYNYVKYNLNIAFNTIIEKESGNDDICEYDYESYINEAYRSKWCYDKYDFKKEIDTDIKMFIETNNLHQYTYLIGYELE